MSDNANDWARQEFWWSKLRLRSIWRVGKVAYDPNAVDSDSDYVMVRPDPEIDRGLGDK